MTSYALLLRGQLRKGSYVCVVIPYFVNLRHTSNANGGDSLQLWRHCCEYTEPLRTADIGCFFSLGGAGCGLPLCYKILRRISEFGAVFGSCWLTFVDCCEFHRFNYGIFREEINSVVR